MKYLVFAFIMLLSGLILLIPSSYGLTPPVPNVDYNEQKMWQQEHLWHLGKNLSVGDSYTYKICDPKTIPTTAANYHYFVQGNDDHNSSTCYIIKLDFVNLLTSDQNHINQRDVWVVQAAIDDKVTTDTNTTVSTFIDSTLIPSLNSSPKTLQKEMENNSLRYSVFHIDTLTFEVTSADTIHPDTKKYADSLQKTLFSLHKYTSPEPELLQIGHGWGEVTEALQPKGENPQMTVLDDKQEFSFTQNETIRLLDKKIESITIEVTDAFEVGYEIDIQDPVIFDEKKKELVPVNDDKDSNNVTTSFLISSQLSFPLYGESYNPVYLMEPQREFEFELLVYQTKNNNIDFDVTESSIVVQPNNDDKKEPIVDSGFIELTFPDDDVDVITNHNDDDDVVIVEPVDNDDTIPDDDVKNNDSDSDDIATINDDVKVQSDNDTEDNNNNNGKIEESDYLKLAGLATLLVLIFVGFIVFKRFKEGKIKTSSVKNTLKKNNANTTTIVSFDEKLYIDIKTQKQY